MGAWPLRLLIYALCATCLAATVAAQTRDPRLSRQQLLFEIANTYRLVADEHFLNDNRDEASSNYKRAAAAAIKLSAENSQLEQSDIDLITNEIAYRQKLLELGMSFWGIEYQLRPLNPVAAWKKFNETTTSFATRVESIARDVEKLAKKADEQVATEVNANKVAEDAAVEQLQSQAADTNLRYADLRRNMLRDRMEAIVARQKSIAGERQSLESQMDAASESLNQLVLNSVASYIGLPPNTVDMVKGAASGDVAGALSSAALAYASSGTTADLGKFGEAVKTAATQYKELRDKYKEAEKIANGSMDVVRAIQSGNTAAMLSTGTQLFDSLPANTRKELSQSLASNKTIKSAVELARQGSELRSTVVGYVTKLPNFGQTLQQLIDKKLDVTEAEFGHHYAEALSALLTNASGLADKQDALSRLAQGWSKTFVDEIIESKYHVAVAVALGDNCANQVACRAALLKKLEAKGFSGPRVTVTPAGAVKITGLKGEDVLSIDVEEIADRTVKRELQIDKVKIKTETKAISAKLSAAQAEATQKFLAGIPDLDFDRHIGALLNRMSPEDQTTAMQTMFPAKADGTDVLSRSLAGFSLGRDLKARIETKAQGEGQQQGSQQQGGAPQAPLQAPKPGGMSATEQQALTVLAATGPYGAAAAAAIQVLAGMEALSNMLEQANRLDAEDRGLTVELLHLAPMNIDLDRDESLALAAKRIADARANGARQRAGLYGTSLELKGGQVRAIEARIAAQLPLTFYLAELLRQEFDQLDRAVALWNGDAAPRGRYLQSRLRADPRTARLALDPDIRLYDWFGRTFEGERKDLGKLAEHWQRMRAVAGQTCNLLGCDNNVADMGQVERTAVVALSTLQKGGPDGGTGSPNTVRFTLLPRHLPTLPRVDRLRLVEVSAVVRNRSGDATSSPFDYRLVHSGLGYLSVDGEGVRESLEPSEPATPRYLPSDESRDERRTLLQGRWRDSGTVGPLEGYPLFGLYEIQVPATFDPDKQEVELVFFYQRPKKAQPADTKLYEKILSCPKERDLRVNAAEVQLLVHKDRGGILRRLDTVADGPDCALKEDLP